MKSLKWIIAAIVITMMTIAKYIGKIEHKQEIGELSLSEYYENSSNNATPSKETSYTPPKEWKSYILKDALIISVPPTVELRGVSDRYTQLAIKTEWYGYKINCNNIVFQQKGLSQMNPDALNTYCRIMIDIIGGADGEFPKATEWKGLTSEDIHNFREYANQNSGEFNVIGTPNVRGIRIDETYGIKVEYTRKGIEGNRTNVSTYYFFNNDKTVVITLSYRQEDAKLWEEDFKKIIKTFQWNNKSKNEL